MPLVSHTDLPTFDRLRSEGHVVLTPERARSQDIRALHIGLLNMMPDAALAATERQFFRLISSSNSVSQFVVHPFTLPQIERSARAQQHIDRYYESLDSIRSQGLDALIISGANVTQPNLAEEVFWKPLIEVIDWAFDNVTSTLCSCLASHAVLQFRYQQRRHSLEEKQWGVYSHDVCDFSHPLVSGINTRFDVPHSRFNVVNPQQFNEAGLHVLVQGEEPGVQLAVSPDGFRIVFFQGHPEYDRVSLLKEYKREVGLFIDGERDTYPPFPDHYFDRHCAALLDEYKNTVESVATSGRNSEKAISPDQLPSFPEERILSRLHNTWHDSGEAIVGNWVGHVYQLTHRDRLLPFMDGIDPQDPLGWLNRNQNARAGLTREVASEMLATGAFAAPLAPSLPVEPPKTRPNTRPNEQTSD